MAEFLVGVMLVLGLSRRVVAAGLLPIAILAVLVLEGRVGISLGDCAYLISCFAGQALLASPDLNSIADEEHQDFTLSFLQNLSR